MYSTIGTIYKAERTSTTTGELAEVYYICALTEDYNTTYLVYDPTEVYPYTTSTSIPSNAVQVGYTPLMTMIGDTKEYQMAGTISYIKDGNEHVAEITGFCKNHFITETEKIPVFCVKEVQYRLTHSVMQILHNTNEVHIYSFSRMRHLSCRPNEKQETSVIIWVRNLGDSDFCVNDVVGIVDINNEFMSNLVSFLYDEYRTITETQNRLYAVYDTDISNVYIVDNLGTTYTIPKFLVKKRQRTKNVITWDMINAGALCAGTIISPISDSEHYVVVGRTPSSVIVEPRNCISENSPTEVYSGIPVDGEFIEIPIYDTSDYCFIGYMSLPIRWRKYDLPVNIDTSVESVREYHVGDVVTLKTEAQILEDCGRDNAGNPNTMAKYTPELRAIGGVTREITGVYNSRYTVEGLETLISADMIQGNKNYWPDKNKSVSGSHHIVRSKINNHLRDMLQYDDNIMTVNLKVGNQLVQVNYCVAALSDTTLETDGMIFYPHDVPNDFSFAALLGNLPQPAYYHLISAFHMADPSPYDVASYFTKSYGYSMKPLYITLGGNCIYEDGIYTQYSNEYVFGKNA